MDPVTQGLFGASASMLGKRQNATKSETRYIYCAGFLSGLVADIDVVIRSKTDPLLMLEYHRAFTHALAFIPVGALLSFAILHLAFSRIQGYCLSKTQLFWSCLLGYASHAPLDALTNYGTSLFLPFSDQRVSLNLMSVVDPFFTVPLILISLWGLLRATPKWHYALYSWMLLIFCFNFINRQAASDQIHKVATERGHQMEMLLVKPTLLNGHLWRTVYRFENRYYVDAVFALPFLGTKFYPGDSLEVYQHDLQFAHINTETRAYKDFQRFSFFSDGLIAVKDGSLIDVRFSPFPQGTTPLWSVRARADLEQHVEYLMNRPTGERERAIFLKMMLGQDLAASELEFLHLN